VSDQSDSGPAPNEEDLFSIDIRVALPQIADTYGIAGFLSGTVDGSRWPSVIAVNRFGQERQLLELQTKKQAMAQAALVRADLESLGRRRWCEKYDVPWSFVTGVPLAMANRFDPAHAWSEPTAFLDSCRGGFGRNTMRVERLLGRAASFNADEIERIGRATESSASELGFVVTRRFNHSVQIAGDAAIAAGREGPFLLIGTKGAEAVTRASVRPAEMAGADSHAVAAAWDRYSATKDTDPATRKEASDNLTRVLGELIGVKARWILPAGVGVQRAALALAVWDLADGSSPLKPKHLDWLLREWKQAALEQDLFPESERRR
jgi:hypothetical protein